MSADQPFCLTFSQVLQDEMDRMVEYMDIEVAQYYLISCLGRATLANGRGSFSR